jgi:hypothetical protein
MMKITSSVSGSLLLVLLLCAGCDSGNGAALAGSWISLSVTSGSPFFKNALAAYEKGDVRLVIDDRGGFTWTDSRAGTSLRGSYEVRGRELLMVMADDGERVTARYRLKRNRLAIMTGDSFVFAFTRDGER